MSLSLVPQSSTNFVRGEQLGHVEPRLWTPPRRELAPETSVGFDQIDFARDVLGRPFDLWQEFAVVHAGELLEDGSPRFRTVLVLVSRQNGKTELPVILAAYWMSVDEVGMILGTSTKLDYAQETWTKTRKLIEKAPLLDGEHDKRWYRLANGEQEMWLRNGSRYKIAASNAEGGRSLTVDRLVMDELRQHKDYSAWDAAVPATSAVWDAQVWCLSNAGDDSSIVLNELREQALQAIEAGDDSGDLALFEWSAEPEADPLDLEQLALANPNLGRRIKPQALLAEARRAVRLGGEALTGFKTEKMCIRVRALSSAIDAAAWKLCAVPDLSLASVRGRLALAVDVAPDQQHATAVVAGVLEDGRVALRVAGAWSGGDCTRQLVAALPGLCATLKPQKLGWLPGGPSASLGPDLTAPKDVNGRPSRRGGWPPPGVEVAEIRGADLAQVCMGLGEQVTNGQIAHPDDPLLNDHVLGAERYMRGDTWVFSRKGEGHCDAAYAAGAAVHLARTMPATVGKIRIVRPSTDTPTG